MKVFLSILFTLAGISFCNAQELDSIHWIEVANQGMSPDFSGTPIFRLPVMVVCNNGDIVIGCEAKNEKDKFQFYAISVSNNGGLSFISKRSRVPMSELVYDRVHDRIFSYSTKTFYASDDHGKTWYDYKAKFNVKIPDSFDLYNMSPTTGIQLKNGILVVPLRFIRFTRDLNGIKTGRTEKTTVFLLCSRDYGKTWEQSPTTPRDIIADEVAVVEYKDNQVMLNARGGTEYFWNKTNNGRRVFVPSAKSSSSIKKWRIDGWKFERESDGKIYDPICHASLIKTNVGKKSFGLFCNPDMDEGEFWPRHSLRVMISKDFKQWKKFLQMTPDDYPVWGYSAMGDYKGLIYFSHEDKEKGIVFCKIGDIRQFVDNK